MGIANLLTTLARNRGRIAGLLDRLGGCQPGSTCGSTGQSPATQAPTETGSKTTFADRLVGALDRAAEAVGGNEIDARPTASPTTKPARAQNAAEQADASMNSPATSASRLLEDVLAILDGAPRAALPDAIDRELAAAARQTAVQRLRGSEALDRFRRELETQSLTVGTVAAVLELLRQVLPPLLVGKATDSP